MGRLEYMKYVKFDTKFCTMLSYSFSLFFLFLSLSLPTIHDAHIHVDARTALLSHLIHDPSYVPWAEWRTVPAIA